MAHKKGEISHGVILSTEENSGDDLKKYVIEKTDEHTQETVSSFDLDSVKKDKIPYVHLKAGKLSGLIQKYKRLFLSRNQTVI